MEFRCACKFWLFLLSSTEFTRDHIASLLREPTTESPPPTTQKLIVSTNTPRLLSVGWELIVDVGDKNVLASADIEYQLEDGGSSSSDFSESEDEGENEIIYPPLEIVGSSDGWVCIGRGKHLYLFEPSTGKSMRVPEEDVSGFPVELFAGFGFAYDSASDDYKSVEETARTVSAGWQFLLRNLGFCHWLRLCHQTQSQGNKHWKSMDLTSLITIIWIAAFGLIGFTLLLNIGFALALNLSETEVHLQSQVRTNLS
ncbi:hypothetical protein Tsubulata_049147 [Turnera subulata]|uniref:Uncharacterized protein n=1 Tax=Turnera subulata TaxID=218843 RepID=A0A9Q0G861_9ROSI|nr:hypothetical protein Tsubulata_049147 [Turnera subulata]